MLNFIQVSFCFLLFLGLGSVTVIGRVRFAGEGVGGFNPPNDFLTPGVSVDLSSWGSILTPVLVLHVSACGASTLLPVGDPPMFFFLQIGR